VHLIRQYNDTFSGFVNFEGNNFLEYFVSYADKLNSEQYPSVKGEILRYVYNIQSGVDVFKCCLLVFFLYSCT